MCLTVRLTNIYIDIISDVDYSNNTVSMINSIL